MRLLGFNVGRKKIEDLVKEINGLLPSELEREEELLNKLRVLVIFLGSEKQKEIENILNSGKEFLTGWNLPPSLKIKFNVIGSYSFYQDFLKDKNLEKFTENLGLFATNPDLNLTKEDIEAIRYALASDISRFIKLNSYFKNLDFYLKTISVPLKLLIRSGIKLKGLYIELRELINSDPKYLKKFKKEDVNTLFLLVYRKLEEFSYLEKIIKLIDGQRLLTRRARHFSFNFRNDEALESIINLKNLVAEVLSDENRRLLGIITFEESIWYAGNEKGQLPPLIKLNLMEIDNSKLVLRRNKSRILRNTLLSVCAAYSLYGVAVPFVLSTTTVPTFTYTEIKQTARVEKQDVAIPSRFGSLPGWLFKSSSNDRIILIAHPLNHNKSWEGPLVDKLTDKGYNVLTFDFPGHGENTSKIFGTVSYGIKEQKAVLDVMKYLEDQGYRQIILVGQSMGAVASVGAAANYNGVMQIKGIAIDGAYSNTKESFRNFGKNRLGIVNPLIDIGTRLGGLVGGVDYGAFDITKDIDNINKLKIPVLYQWGDKDEMLPQSAIEALKIKAQSKDTVIIYPGGKHTDLWYEMPQRSNDVVKFVLDHMQSE